MDNISKLETYIQEHSSPEPGYLRKIAHQTHLRMLHPQMLSGYLQGRFLSMVSKIIRPANILELGTYTGYSALCLAEGLAPCGQITTIELNDEQEDFILNNFNNSPYSKSIRLIIGAALEVMPKLKTKFDLVFIDADKKEYPQYLKTLKPLLNKNAIIIADNVLWYEKVLDSVKNADSSSTAIMQFNQIVNNDPDFENLILPVRDGLNLIRYVV